MSVGPFREEKEERARVKGSEKMKARPGRERGGEKIRMTSREPEATDAGGKGGNQN